MWRSGVAAARAAPQWRRRSARTWRVPPPSETSCALQPPPAIGSVASAPSTQYPSPSTRRLLASLVTLPSSSLLTSPRPAAALPANSASSPTLGTTSHSWYLEMRILSLFQNHRAARDSSNLLAHEAAFALGQMQDAEAIPALEAVLKDLSLHPIVRHEAAEALGAIGLEKSISLLEESLAADPAVEVQETCELAIRRIEEQKNASGIENATVSPFLSVDPALPAKQGLSVEQLRELLLNEQESMYERYAALFALRNDSGDAAVSAIVAALGVKSALLRHEVAYVLGQLQNKAAADALSTVLKNVDEHPMVRHEAAEALGSIADQESIALLEEFAKDPEPIVSQSCEVALSMLEYERSGKAFEFLFLQTPQVQQES